MSVVCSGHHAVLSACGTVHVRLLDVSIDRLQMCIFLPLVGTLLLVVICSALKLRWNWAMHAAVSVAQS